MLHLGGLGQIRFWRAAWIALLPLAFSSCGSGDRPSVPLLPTKGQVFYQGQPAVGATVILHPLTEQGDWKKGYPSGAVVADGSVKIQTAGEWDGAPAGEYALLVVWMPDQSGDQQTSEEEIEDKLGGRYSDHANSAWKVKVEGTGCELPRIDLQ
ncbi:MAG: hypothetical protein ACR2FY_20820 [Pirellulaceae bacterium]